MLDGNDVSEMRDGGGGEWLLFGNVSNAEGYGPLR